ncbi:hypothetical protein L9F63_006242, partial [Diploptera punctata]
FSNEVILVNWPTEVILADISMIKIFMDYPLHRFKVGLWPLISTFRYDPTCHYHWFRSRTYHSLIMECWIMPKLPPSMIPDLHLLSINFLQNGLSAHTNPNLEDQSFVFYFYNRYNESDFTKCILSFSQFIIILFATMILLDPTNFVLTYNQTQKCTFQGYWEEYFFTPNSNCNIESKISIFIVLVVDSVFIIIFPPLVTELGFSLIKSSRLNKYTFPHYSLVERYFRHNDENVISAGHVACTMIFPF